jgi:hypothetical protein
VVDQNSLSQDPLFVDLDGADNLLGWASGSNDGRDDDFHERSRFGSFHGGSLAPVEGFSFFGPGAPVALVATETLDAQQSPAIDRGDPADPFAREPSPNGGYVNIGAYGNTEQASKSAAEFLILIDPNGGESITQGTTFDIRWHHAGGATVDLQYSATGLAGPFTTFAAGEANDGLYEWTVDPAVFAIGDDYAIRVVSSATATINDTSDAVFAIDAPPFQVVSLTPTTTGFAVRFNRALDAAPLNLYDGAGATLGLPDVALAGPTGAVRGSIVLDADGAGFVFVATGGPLAAGNYAVTLESGVNAIVAIGGEALDGNADGTGGDDYAAAFDIVTAAGGYVGIADFARGPEQAAGVADGVGVPLRITGAGTFTTASFTLRYDPALLTVTGVADPAGGVATVDLATPGIAHIDVVFAAPVSGANRELGRLLGTVPATAPYGAKQRLDIDAVALDGVAGAAADNDGVHVVAYIGDASGNARYTSLDSQRIQRVIVRLDSGFSAWPLADPVIVGDVNGNGRLDAADALLVQRKIVGLPAPQIPDLPASPPTVFRSGPDPLVSLGTVAAARPGEVVTVPVQLDTATGLESAQVRLAYDAAVFDVAAVRRGTLTGDFGWFYDVRKPGELLVDMSRLNALAGGAGTLVEVDLRVKAGAAPGRHAIDLDWASLNDGGLTLNPAPQPGPDPTDTSVQVIAPVAPVARGLTAAAARPAASPVARQAVPDIGWWPVDAPALRSDGAGEDWREDFVNGRGERERKATWSVRVPK